ncbi:FAD-binding domain-containing protein [Schizopora paradoxa]|uniref:FAD-binding domain-containing protein n=1 Tax=Schizopora paradoxa TaxID=27342 RepID=A0A0H2RAD1_9AGAM|nr:FAD-binding domain-containing protein [Schizopora paradoxa]
MRSSQRLLLPVLALFLTAPFEVAFANSNLIRENAPRSTTDTSSAKNACAALAKTFENSTTSGVFFAPSANFEADLLHYMNSSAQVATCSVEPGTPQDVAKVLQIIRSSRSPFAVKGGGHATNPGFSSTTGVQIAMTRFNEVNLSPSNATVDIGTGLIWDDVYASLEASGCNCNVVGGRVSGVGVAGFSLGGGYSWKSSQFGLTIDTIKAYELVLPNSTITTVTATSHPDLFFGLRGGFNNFGIVTKLTLRTFPQTEVFGGFIQYLPEPNVTEAVMAATTAFCLNNTDPKAQIIVGFSALAEQTIVTLSFLYDAPTPPPGLFDALLAPPAIATDVSTRSFSSLVASSPVTQMEGFRGRYETVSIASYTENVVNVISNLTQSWAQNLTQFPANTTFVSFDIESFTSALFTHSTSPSAYPPDRSRPLFPLNLDFAWLDPTLDDFFHSGIIQSAETIANTADAEGQNIGNAELYGNYAVDGTPIERIYGANLPRLKAIKAAIDPEGVMNLAGGWKF